jgi:nitrate reductase gamma subunit
LLNPISNMMPFRWFIASILPYIAIGIFAGGVIHRLSLWARSPRQPAMTLYPSEGAGTLALVKEAMFFPSLYKGDKPFWLIAWSFHAALSLAFVGHFRAVSGLFDRTLGLNAAQLSQLSLVAGGLAGGVLLVSALLLLVRRLVLTRVREISKAPDFLALFLLVAVIATGNLLRFGPSPVDLEEVRGWFASLAAFSPALPSSSYFILHLLSAELLLLYIAFSKLMHFGGFFFTISLLKAPAR